MNPAVTTLGRDLFVPGFRDFRGTRSNTRRMDMLFISSNGRCRLREDQVRVAEQLRWKPTTAPRCDPGAGNGRRPPVAEVGGAAESVIFPFANVQGHGLVKKRATVRYGSAMEEFPQAC